VYFSNREMIILRLLTEKKEGVSMDELMRILQVSKRTVYREISGLENTLDALDINLQKEEEFYQLNGSEEAIAQLLEKIGEPITIEWVDVETRQWAELATIGLQKNKEYTLTGLASLFEVSLSTIQQDINRLNEIAAKYNIALKRTEDYRLYLSGSEVYIRLYLSQILLKEINKFDFFQLLMNNEEDRIETESQYMLSLIDKEILQMVYQSFEQEQPEIFNQLADDDLINFVLIISLSLLRLKNNHHIESTQQLDHNQLLPYLQQILSIVKKFDSKEKALLNMTELSFLAMQLRGMNVRKQHSIFQNAYDMELGFNIKYLMRLVSKEFKVNFNTDNVLYQDLVNHVGAALKRIDLNLPEMENAVINQLKEEYAELYSIVEEKLIEVFSPTIFSEQEIGYVVTHFASSFEKYSAQRGIKVLVVCTSGIGTSKILKARLERSIPEMKEIDVVRAADLQEVDLQNYELIFSTITLSGFDADYRLINPILDDEEIASIKDRIHQYISNQAPSLHGTPPSGQKETSFEKVKRLVQVSDQLIENIEVMKIAQAFRTIEDYLSVVFNDDPRLKDKLEQRLNESSLAIPNTGIMLLHTADESVKTPSIELHHLEKPIVTTGMDYQPTKVYRIIVMLAPDDMDELTAEFLGIISSSIIEKEAYTEIYQKGNTQELKELLEHLSVNTLQKMLK